jgi:transcriptional regulator with XRE-family HTH domain
MMHNGAVDEAKLRARVHERMARDGLTQRALAVIVGVSQGHISKVLRVYSSKRGTTRTLRRLTEWLNSAPVPKDRVFRLEGSGLANAVAAAVGDSPEAMQIAIGVMQFLGEMRRLGSTPANEVRTKRRHR